MVTCNPNLRNTVLDNSRIQVLIYKIYLTGHIVNVQKHAKPPVMDF